MTPDPNEKNVRERSVCPFLSFEVLSLPGFSRSLWPKASGVFFFLPFLLIYMRLLWAVLKSVLESVVGSIPKVYELLLKSVIWNSEKAFVQFYGYMVAYRNS